MKKHGAFYFRPMCRVLALSVLLSPSLFAQTALSDREESPIEINIGGADESLATNLKALLPSLRNIGCDATRERMDRFIAASADKLVEGAEAMGYFSAQFNMTAARDAECWVLNLAVRPGEPVRVRNMNIRLSGAGQSLPAFRKVMAEKPYAQGDVLVTAPYEDFKTRLSSTASRLGFFDAEFTARRIAVNIDQRVADIDLHFETGERYRIGKVTVQQDVLGERFIKRYIRLQEGDIYDSDKLLEQRRLLEGSGYYQDVQVNSQFSKAENRRVPVAINTLRRERYTYTANIGYATDTNVRLETGMETHWVNQRGHQLDAKARLSQHDPAVGFTYKVPLWQPEHEYASIRTDWALSDNNDIKGEKLELEFNYNRRNSADWQQTAFVSFLNEKTQIEGQDETTSQLTLLGARVNKTEKNDSLFPTRGWRVNAELVGAHDSLLSDQSVLQASLDAKYLYTFDHEGKLIARGEFGASLIDEADSVPKSLRFFAGGQNSVRGYAFESIGQRDAENHVIGGQNLIVASAEYEYPVTEKISAAAFVDAGSAFDDWDDYSFSVGYGVGARYKSPLGPIRFDLAVPSDDSSDLHFYFSLGPDL